MSKNAGIRKVFQALAILGLFFGFVSIPGAGTATAAPPFNVLALYHGTWDAGHISFTRDANQWFPQAAAQNNFTYTASTNWNLLNANDLSRYQVVMFLDDLPATASQRAAFEQYMRNGGGFFGWHVSAFNTNPNSWSWYHNTLLGTGAFRGNTWQPSAATLRVDNRTHASTSRLPATFRSAVSEWYSWNNDLRTNPNISVLASIDPSSFPLGNQEGNIWRSGYYPIMWTNKNYKMIYANFGHNAVSPQQPSSTFASAEQNKFIVDSLLWLGGGTTPPDPGGPIPPNAWFSMVNKASSKCIDARGAATANGTAIQQYTCNNSLAQQYQVQPTNGGFARINNRANSAQVIDVSGVSAADNALLHLWAYGGGNNQQWQAVPEDGGFYHFVSRHSSKCLTVPNGSTADSVQLVQLTCNGSAAQSFSLTQQG